MVSISLGWIVNIGRILSSSAHFNYPLPYSCTAAIRLQSHTVPDPILSYPLILSFAIRFLAVDILQVPLLFQSAYAVVETGHTRSSPPQLSNLTMRANILTSALLTVSLAVAPTAGQTYTTCNPLTGGTSTAKYRRRIQELTNV